MKRGQKKRSGFSLMEVNMAIFVMAVGVLSMVALFPLGIRESVQSQADLKQTMFADYLLNAIVSAASNPDLPWLAQWRSWALNNSLEGEEADYQVQNLNTLPNFVETIVNHAETEYNRDQPSRLQLRRNETYAVYCVPVSGHSSLIMGILVRSLSMDTSEMDAEEMRRRLEAQPVYYAEVRFQGAIP